VSSTPAPRKCRRTLDRLGHRPDQLQSNDFCSGFRERSDRRGQDVHRRGSFTPGSGSPAGANDVTLVFAGDNTQPGSYAVDVSHSASQATDTGSATFASGASPVPAAESYTVTSSGSSASYGITAGESLEQVASGLDSAFAEAGMDLSAQVVSNGSSSSLQITSANYGSQNSFSVSSTGSDELGLVGSTFVGTDVAGRSMASRVLETARCLHRLRVTRPLPASRCS